MEIERKRMPSKQHDKEKKPQINIRQYALGIRRQIPDKTVTRKAKTQNN